MTFPDELALVVRFRGAGWRYPLRVGDQIEVWSKDVCVGHVPARLVLHVVSHYVQGALLADQVQTALRAPLPRLRGATGRRLRGRT